MHLPSYPQSVAFVKGEASEEKVKVLSQDYEVIHFAAHAELSKEDPISSAVLLARGGKEDGRLEVREDLRYGSQSQFGSSERL